MRILILSTIILLSAFCGANAQIITTVAGGDTVGLGDGGPATACELTRPIGVAIDGYGNLYIADRDANRIRKVNTSGVITTIAGIGGTSGFSGDNGPATAAKLNAPLGLAIDAVGNVYFSDVYNQRIRKVDTSGIITTIAGTDSIGYSGDNGPATLAKLNFPHGVAIDSIGNVYFADINNNCIRKVNTSGIIFTYAGTGAGGYSGDSGMATSAKLNEPYGIALDQLGSLYIADMSNARVRKIDTSGIITTVAGDGGLPGGDGGPATAAGIGVTGVTADKWGNIYIGDPYHFVIRKVNAEGVISTIAGISGFAGYNGDDQPAVLAKLSEPTGVCVDSSGNIYVADFGNSRVRRISSSTAGINTLNNTEIRINIYPNPSQGAIMVSIVSPISEQEKIVICNAFGEIIQETTVPSNLPTTLQLNQPSGIYYLTLISPQVIINKTITIIK